MKIFKKVLLVVAILTALAIPTRSRAQVITQLGLFTNSVPAGTTTVAVNNTNVFNLRANQGLSFSPKFVMGAASISNVVYGFNILQGPGTNWTTTLPIKITSTAFGTTNVIDFTNVPPSVLNNARAIRLDSINNTGGSTLTIIGIGVGYFP